jgi:glycosyltransferase involved in cell wall biosynthesis
MNIGIYTRWQRRDSTYAAIQIADLLSQWRHEVTILTPTPTKPPVSSFWDGHVRHDSQVRFTEWAAPLALVIWLFCPHPGQPVWAKNANKRTVLVPDWADLSVISEVGPLFWRVLAPTRCWANLLADRGARNVVHCPWSPVLPITERSHAGPVKVYVPPVDRPGEDDESTAVDIIEAVLSLNKSVQATISTDGRRSALAKRLERLAKAQPRLTLDRPADYHQQVLRYGEHSLTMLTTVVENFAMSALCSFHMGTPVVGFNAPSLDEVANPQNSVLVALSDQRGLLDALMALIEQPKLSRLFAGCQAGLAQRRLEFEAVWMDAVRKLR